jgi:uncharacterized protein DUF3857/transglutaminase superfamily protein
MLTSRTSRFVSGGFEARLPPPRHLAPERRPNKDTATGPRGPTAHSASGLSDPMPPEPVRGDLLPDGVLGGISAMDCRSGGPRREVAWRHTARGTVQRGRWRVHGRCPVVLSLVLFLIFHSAAVGVDWAPINPLNLELENPRVDPSADAEAIFWETWVEDRPYETIFTQYLRVKVFTKRGAEEQSTVKVPSHNYIRVHGIKARTIKPDGSIVPLKEASIFETTELKVGGLKLKTKSFAIPDVKPGDIIEYKWIETHEYGPKYFRLSLQRDIPVWKVKYHVKPSAMGFTSKLAMGSQCFNIDSKKFGPDKLFGFEVIEYENLPAFKSEPYMPPEDQVRSWILAAYFDKSQFREDTYWHDLGKEFFKYDQDAIKVDKRVRQTVATIVGGVSDPEEKLRLIRKFCLTEIKDFDQDRFGFTAEEREHVKARNRPSETIKKRCGTQIEIAYAYAALLKAAGLDARIARVAGRDESFFSTDLMVPHFLNRTNVAVSINGKWQFSDPLAPYLPHGMLLWAEEGVPALIPDSKKPLFVKTPMSGPEKSVVRRRARLRLDEQGTLEGTVKLEFGGHFGARLKDEADGLSAEECEADIREGILERVTAAEVSDIKIENVTDLEKPYTYSYTIRVPRYATPTGSRLFLQPALFQFGREPRFKTSERKYDVYFPFAWTEDDEVRIQLPEGFELEDAESPGGINFGPAGHYQVRLVKTIGHALKYNRKLVFGDGGYILFPVERYPLVKEAFDQCHREDNHAVTLRRTTEPSVSQNRR